MFSYCSQPRCLACARKAQTSSCSAGCAKASSSSATISPTERQPSQRHVQPGVRFAVDAYVNFARSRPWEEAAISSLTEMFAPKIHADRLASWPALYPWIDVEGLAYFRSRIPLATRDVEHGLEVARRWCSTRARQERAIAILHFKLDILWSMLDSIQIRLPWSQRWRWTTTRSI